MWDYWEVGSVNKTKIEWCDYTVNPIKGMCRNDCWYCYAKRMYKRFGWDKHIKLDLNVFNDIQKLKKPSKIFVGSMHDIFGSWIPHHWIIEIQNIIGFTEEFKKHTFIFLTKFPKRYTELPPFPENCWLGATITGEEDSEEQYEKSHELYGLDSDNLVFISFEPLLGDVDVAIQYYLDWIIVGGLTPKNRHEIKWVRKIISKSKTMDIPVFIKDNLKWPEKIQEFPNEKP